MLYIADYMELGRGIDLSQEHIPILGKRTLSSCLDLDLLINFDDRFIQFFHYSPWSKRNIHVEYRLSSRIVKQVAEKEKSIVHRRFALLILVSEQMWMPSIPMNKSSIWWLDRKRFKRLVLKWHNWKGSQISFPYRWQVRVYYTKHSWHVNNIYM